MHRILICGCSSGIGRYLFKHYYSVKDVICEGWARRPGEDIKYWGDAKDAATVFGIIHDFKPDVVINCIGIGGLNHSLLTTAEQYEEIISNNLRTTFLICRDAGHHMLKLGHGRIINFGSCTTSMELEGESVYTASKSAVVSFSRVLAKELSPHITVNCISPGPVDTKLIRRVPKEKIQAVIDRQIIKRWTTFDEIRHVVDFLIDSPMITGQNIFINGAG